MKSNTMTGTGVLVSSLFAVLFSIAATASGTDFLDAFPNAQLERSELEQQQNHPVIVNRMKKVNGVVTSDDASWLEGELTRKLYLLPQGQDSKTGYDFFVDQFKTMGVKELFRCQSFSCGESNFWANDIFNIALLYGQNRQQHYFIGEKLGAYYSVYSVRRGNGRIYALVDIFRSASDSQVADISFEQLTRRGYTDLYITGNIAESGALDQLQYWLKQESGANLVLQVQGLVPDSLNAFDSQRATLEAAGQKILQKLINGGVDSKRVRMQTALSVSAASELPDNAIWLRVFLL